jgi:hypothetical protein
MDMLLLLSILIAVIALVGAFDVFALKYGAEDRPGFDERRPLV